MTDIRWAMWLAASHVELWQAVLLSLGINPSDDVKRTATSGRETLLGANRFLRSRGREPHLELPSEYWDRLSLSQVGLSADGPIRPQGSKHPGVLHDSIVRVLLGEVANFLTLGGFKLPEEMRAPQLTAVPTAQPELAPAAQPESVAAVEAAPETTAQAVLAPAVVSAPPKMPLDALPGESPAKGRQMKRAALIQANFPRWESIERDLKDAAANGLTDRAKAGHGHWWEGLALAWAEEKGKLKGMPAAGSPGMIHRFR